MRVDKCSYISAGTMMTVIDNHHNPRVKSVLTMR